jgi:hypothetical protein
MKDDLIDEERARQEEAAQETLEQKIDRYTRYQSPHLGTIFGPG